MAPKFKDLKVQLKTANQKIAELEKKNQEKEKEINVLKELLKSFKAEKKAAPTSSASSSAPESSGSSSGAPKPRGRVTMGDWSVIVEKQGTLKSCVMDFDGSQRNAEIVLPIQQKVMNLVELQVRKAKTLINSKVLKEETEQYDLMNVIRGMDDYSSSQFASELPKELPVLPGNAEFYEDL